MKYHILHDFRTSALFEEKSSDHFKELHRLKLPFNDVVNVNFITPHQELQFMNVFKMIRGF